MKQTYGCWCNDEDHHGKQRQWTDNSTEFGLGIGDRDVLPDDVGTGRRHGHCPSLGMKCLGAIAMTVLTCVKYSQCLFGLS